MWKYYWRRFYERKVAVLGAVLFLLCALITLAGPLLLSRDPAAVDVKHPIGAPQPGAYFWH